MEVLLGKGSKIRLKRIQDLRQCSERAAVEYAISVAWLIAERHNREMKIQALLKKEEEKHA